MCERCDANFVVSGEVAALFLRAPPTPAGAVFLAAIGRALLEVVPRVLSLSPGESYTPKMDEVASRTGKMAADRFLATYAEGPK
jgi:hypothetical protein